MADQRQRHQEHIILIFLLLAAFLPAACAEKRPITKVTVAPTSEYSVCHLALFPMVTEDQNIKTAMLATRIFLSELVREGIFHLEPEGNVRSFLRRNRVLPGKIIDSSLYTICAGQLGVDAIIIGRITESGMAVGPKKIRNPYLSLQIELVDVRTKKRLVTTFLRREGMDYRRTLHFGIVETMSGLLSLMSQEIIADWREKGWGGC